VKTGEEDDWRRFDDRAQFLSDERCLYSRYAILVITDFVSRFIRSSRANPKQYRFGIDSRSILMYVFPDPKYSSEIFFRNILAPSEHIAMGGIIKPLALLLNHSYIQCASSIWIYRAVDSESTNPRIPTIASYARCDARHFSLSLSLSLSVRFGSKRLSCRQKHLP